MADKNNCFAEGIIKFNLQNTVNNLIIILCLCFLKHISRGKSVRRVKQNDSSLSHIMIMKFLDRSIQRDHILMSFKAICYRVL